MTEPKLPSRRSWWAIALLLAASLAMSAGTLTSQALPEWATEGKFEARIDFPADTPVMIHASVLPDGKVIFWGRDKEVDASGETIYDVVSQSKVRSICLPPAPPQPVSSAAL